MRYTWNNRKAAANRREHGVNFQDAIEALEDPNRLEDIDTRFDYEEERIQVIGMAQGRVLFVVATMLEEDRCRIISARKAERREQNRYFTDNHQAG